MSNYHDFKRTSAPRQPLVQPIVQPILNFKQQPYNVLGSFDDDWDRRSRDSWNTQEWNADGWGWAPVNSNSDLTDSQNLQILESFTPSPNSRTSQIQSSLVGKKCLDALGGNYDNGTQITLYDCNGANSQKWIYDTNTQQLASYGNNNMCIGLNNPNNNQSSLILSPCAEADTNVPNSQKWNFNNGEITQGGRCLDVPGGKAINNVSPSLYDCKNNGAANQYWISGFSS
jgi:hypothetical protein